MTTKVALMMCGLTDKAKSANKSQVKMLLERDSEIDIFVAAVKPAWSIDVEKLYTKWVKDVYLYDDEVLAKERNIHSDKRTLQQYKRVVKCWEIVQNYEKRNKIKYDLVMRMRFDTSVENPLELEQFKDIQDNQAIMFAGKELRYKKTMNCCDAFIIAKHPVIDIYTNFYHMSGYYFIDGKHRHVYGRKFLRDVEAEMLAHLHWNKVDVQLINNYISKITIKHLASRHKPSFGSSGCKWKYPKEGLTPEIDKLKVLKKRREK